MQACDKLSKRADLVAILVLCLSCTLGSARVAYAGYEPERTSWGTPHIDGIWDFRTLTPLERPPELAGKALLTPGEAQAFREKKIQQFDSDSRVGAGSRDLAGAYNAFWFDRGTEVNEDLRTSLIIDPIDGRLPDITPAAMARLDKQTRLRIPPVRDLVFNIDSAESRPTGPEVFGLSDRCLVGFNAGPPLVPSSYNNNLRIIQTPDYIVLVTEMIHDARIIPLDGRPHLSPEMRRWSGDSRGRWEGNILIVDTTNFTDKTPTFQLPGATRNLSASGGVGSGMTLHLTERFIPTGKGQLLYEYTIDDPSTFTSPFTVSIPMRSSEGPIFEYACHEGNRAVPNMLKGARLLDSEDAVRSR
jgi:hypothetical protein